MLIKKLKQDGWVERDGLILPQKRAQDEAKHKNGAQTGKKKSNRSKGLKTAWIDDYRNLRNKDAQNNFFIRLVKMELSIDVWPEFFFSLDRQFRIDYAIPVDSSGRPVKIAIEVEGGIWMRGNSGHSSGTGIKRDMEKSNHLHEHGWRLLRFQPIEIKNEPLKVIEMIKKVLQS